MNIHQSIREMRKGRNLTQEQLADAMGVSTASVSKWENGQCAPDLAILSELADFFEISIDTLVGHTIDPKRLDALIAEANALADSKKVKEAAALTDKILRSYPNSLKAAEQCIQIFYKLFLFSAHKPYMEDCVKLTQRLFVLNPSMSEIQKLENTTRLANQHELLEDWETAKKYYAESNYAGTNERNIAICLNHQKKPTEALATISDVILANLYHQFMDALTLSEAWEQLGNLSNAIQALQWADTSLGLADYAPHLRMLLYVRIAKLSEAAGDISQAKEMIRKAARMTKKQNHPGNASFLSPSKKPAEISNESCNEEALKALLSKVSPTLRRTAMAELE